MAVDNPPSDEPKSERFNMFISKSELSAIDDWAWKNRVRSKSEAVRRLVQMGLILDENAMQAAEDFLNLNERFRDGSNRLLAFLAEIGGAERDFDDPRFDRLVLLALKMNMDVHEYMSYLEHRLNIIFQAFQTLESTENFEQVRKKLVAVKAAAKKEALENRLEIERIRLSSSKISNEDEE